MFDVNRKLTIREKVKILLLSRGISMRKLVKQINEKKGVDHRHTNLSRKLVKNTIRYAEVEEIAELLDYEIVFKDKRKK